jgi:cytosine/adenosine deaminase-related metal-dependent hydrolase
MTINAHTHLYSGLAPLGMPAPAERPEAFVDILEEVWWRLDRALDADSLRASARYYIAAARELGCRGLIDHHESPGLIDGSLDIIADACQDLGMPALLCYGATERNGGRAEAERGLAECRRFVRDNARPLVRGAVGLHASFTVSDETIREAGELCRELGVPLHVHVAEAGSDVEDARERGYAGVIDRLEALGALVPGSIFAHGVHLTATEVGAVDAAGIWLVHNPRSNAGNRVGYASVLAASSRVALGTDGYPAAMAEEQAAIEEGAEVAATRLAGSSRLFSELMGDVAPAADDIDRAAIDADARAAADRLWARMRAID